LEKSIKKLTAIMAAAGPIRRFDCVRPNPVPVQGAPGAHYEGR
jgi:hypothetical protein